MEIFLPMLQIFQKESGDILAKKNISFEEALAKIEKIVEDLENNDIPLEKSVQLYKQGMELSVICRDKLNAIEEEVKILQNNGKGGFSQKPFEYAKEEE